MCLTSSSTTWRRNFLMTTGNLARNKKCPSFYDDLVLNNQRYLNKTNVQLVSSVCIGSIVIEGVYTLWFPCVVASLAVIFTGLLILCYMCSIPYEITFIRWPWAEMVSVCVCVNVFTNR
jgi:hypothetical protein